MVLFKLYFLKQITELLKSYVILEPKPLIYMLYYYTTNGTIIKHLM